MRFHDGLLNLAWFFLPPAIIGIVYVYFYPVAQDCGFPEAKAAESACYFDGSKKPAVPAEIAPFRLLALGDPQLEGDTSLPKANAPTFPSLERLWEDGGETGLGGLRKAAIQLATSDIPKVLQGYRKRLDLWGNDRYLAHVFRTVSWWTQPTHIVVLGDLLGSQWIGDDEFNKRSKRFWKTVFKGTEMVRKEITDRSGRTETLGEDERWRKRIIAVAGNHDIGYAGDIDEHRTERFENSFGSVNWDVSFRLNKSTSDSKWSAPSAFQTLFEPPPPELRLIILNSMNLDEPAKSPELRQQSLDFLDDKLRNHRPHKAEATILLTHIPLHKKAGVCTDPPFFSFFPSWQGGGIKEQNHLGEDTSELILDGLVPNAERAVQAIVLNGHDHAGCDTNHYRGSTHTNDSVSGDSGSETSPATWHAERYQPLYAFGDKSNVESGLREITVQSMMGSYSGNAGLLSAWFDEQSQEWKFDYATCPFGIQHIWWAVHILGLVDIGLWVGGFVLLVRHEWAALQEEERKQKTA